MLSKKEKIVLRLLTLGDSGCGKSSFVCQYCDSKFVMGFMPTIGIDFRLKNIERKNGDIKIQIWDTAGQERFRAITKNYYRGCHGIILIYDVTSHESFDNIRKWINDIRENADNNPVIIIVANKIDLVDTRVISKESGLELAKEYNMPYFECSAKSGFAVNEAMTCLIDTIVIAKNPQQNNDEPEPDTLNVQNPSTPTKESKCCS